ncbi:MAG: Tn3 family transposase [Geminicoccaceae bacterium]|nr:Tn3 family transposase [Geminicoccaceae bacterium]
MERARHLARPPDDRHFEELCAYWQRVHRLFKALLQRITFDANPIAEPVREALDFLAGLENWTKGSLKGAPTACIGPAWKRHVFDGGNTSPPTNNRAFVFSVLEAMRKALKRRDIFVQSSIRFANPTRGLLDDKTWLSSRPTILRALGRSADAEFEISRLGNQLDLAYRRTIDHLPKNPDLRFENGELVVTQLDKLDEPASLVALRKQIHRRLPKIELPEILLETAARTGFARPFTHLSEKHARVDSFDISLCAVLIAEACNIGIEPLIRDDYPPLRRDRLSWIGQNFVRDETLRAANARLIEAYDALPIVRAWGTGDIASADGIRFAVRGNPIHAGPNPKYFGIKRGITWYNLVSDHSAGLSGIPVPGTLRDSMMILALLLEQETHLQPTEIMTDTAAYSDVVFALFWLLGYQFSPRLADIGGARFWRIDKTADYGPFDPLSRHRIDIELIIQCWDDLLRLAASLRMGKVQATGIMHMLQVRDRPTTLAKALGELGRIIKTIHILDFIGDGDRRRRILTQLNRHEYRHKLARHVCYGKRGEFDTPRREAQAQKLGALDLVLNMIAYWNAIYIEATIEQLEREGRTVDLADTARVSPLPYGHINVHGRYSCALPEPIAKGELRPLRNLNYE